MNANNLNFVRPFHQLVGQLPVHYFWQADIIFGAVTIFGIISWYFIPEEKWLSKTRVSRALHTAINLPQVTVENTVDSA